MHSRTHQLLAALVALSAPATSLADDPSVFDHRQHLDKAKQFPKCGACHTDSERADTMRPGQEGHATCDGAECHVEAFSPAAYAKSELCTICHVKKTRIELPNNLKPFPPEKAVVDYYAEISHKSHLVARVKKKLKDTCLDCHVIDSASKEVARPGHAQCVSCHDDKSKVPMSSCDQCHRFKLDDKGREVPTGPRGRANPCRVTDKFSHDKHRFDRRAKQAGKPVSCGQCHFGLEKAQTLAAIIPTNGRNTMLNACGSCHRAGQRSDQGKSVFATTGDCSLCHKDACLSVGPLPSWHK